jgi:hypothetical protein
MDKKTYEEELKRKQEEHLQNVDSYLNQNWQPCLHDNCPECKGTGIKLNGGCCVHNISCPCSKCTPYN